MLFRESVIDSPPMAFGGKWPRALVAPAAAQIMRLDRDSRQKIIRPNAQPGRNDSDTMSA